MDLSRPIAAAVLEAIRQAWLENLVLVFPGQKLDPQSLVTFTRNFGELDDYATQPFNRHPQFNEVFVLTNQRTNGKPSPTYNSGRPEAGLLERHAAGAAQRLPHFFFSTVCSSIS